MPSKETTVQLLGLATNPNRFSLPQGSCSVADNVVLRKPGVISSCPAQDPYEFTTNDGPADTAFPVRLFANFNRNYAIAVEKQPADANGSVLRFSDDFNLYTTAVLGATTRTLRFDPGETQHNFVRNRHIITEHSSPIVMDVNGTGHATSLRPAGLPPPAIIALNTTSSTPTFLSNGNYVAYQTTYRRVTSNFELVSAPSAVRILQNTSGSSKGVQITHRFALAEPIIAGDYLDVYRVVQKGTVDELGDEFALAFSYQFTSADILAGSVVLVDPTLDDSLDAGTALYTNSMQDGSGQANLMPPASVDVETFNDVTFYATKNAWPIIDLFIPGVYGDLTSASTTDKKAGIGRRAFTGDTNAASTDITNVANVDGLAPFQIVYGAGLATQIVSIIGSGPYTVRMDTVLGFTSVGTAFTCDDSFKIRTSKDGVSTDTLVAAWPSFSIMSGNAATQIAGIRTLLGGVYDTTQNVTGLNFSFWFPHTGLVDSFEIYASNGANYSPNTPFNTLSGLSKFVSTQDTKRNRVYFSKAQLPEAVAPTNFLDVGKETVLKLKRTQSSLLAFCTDGLWRITGSGTDWSVDQLDPDCRLVHPDCVESTDNTMFAWVLDGLATVGDDGANTFSTDAIGPEIRGFATDYIGFGAPYIWGPNLACDLRNREVWLNLGYNAALTNQWNKSYIFNLDTQQFTTQSTSIISCQSYAPFLLNLLSGSISPDSYSLPSTTEWLAADVQFNPITAGERGSLKQWIDVNSFFENESLLAKIKLTFNAVDTAELTRIGNQLENMHFFVPRHCASKPELQFGFKFVIEDGFPAPQFDLCGWTARFRVASETIKR